MLFYLYWKNYNIWIKIIKASQWKWKFLLWFHLNISESVHLSQLMAVHQCQELLKAGDRTNKLLHHCNNHKLLHITDRQNKNRNLLEALHSLNTVFICNVAQLSTNRKCINMKLKCSWTVKSYLFMIFLMLCIPNSSIQNKTEISDIFLVTGTDIANK